MFCMLLRKHLTGGRLVSMQQPEMERLLDLTFDCTDEMGGPTRKHLILEIMGRNSNLILTGEDGRILDCLRRVDFEMSEKRQVLPRRSVLTAGCWIPSAASRRLCAGSLRSA